MFKKNRSPEQALADAHAAAIKAMARSVSKGMKSDYVHEQEKALELADKLLQLLGSDDAVRAAVKDAKSS